MAAGQVTGHFFDGPIAKNIFKGVLLQHVKFHVFIIKWTISSYITTSQPNYISILICSKQLLTFFSDSVPMIYNLSDWAW